VNKAELIDALARHYDGSKVEATKALNAVVQTITFSAAAGNKVVITGFGVFEKVDRPARMVRNPRTGERKEAAATSVPRFRAGTDLKAYVSGERPLPDLAAASGAVRARPAASRNGSDPAVAAAVPEPAVKAAGGKKQTAAAKKDGKREQGKGKTKGPGKGKGSKATAKKDAAPAKKKKVGKKAKPDG